MCFSVHSEGRIAMKFMSAAPFKCSIFVNATVPTVNSEHIEPLKYCNNLEKVLRKLCSGRFGREREVDETKSSLARLDLLPLRPLSSNR